MHLTPSQLATTLAALRHFQRSVPRIERAYLYAAHFDHCEPLSDPEIDALCEALNFAADPSDFVRLAHAVRVLKTFGGPGGIDAERRVAKILRSHKVT